VSSIVQRLDAHLAFIQESRLVFQTRVVEQLSTRYGCASLSVMQLSPEERIALFQKKQCLSIPCLIECKLQRHHQTVSQPRKLILSLLAHCQIVRWHPQCPYAESNTTRFASQSQNTSTQEGQSIRKVDN